MITSMDLQILKNQDKVGADEYYSSFVDENENYKSITEDLAISKELDIPISEGVDSIYGKPNSINIPVTGSLELSFAPCLTDAKGDFTFGIDEETDTVKSDPFDISPIANPEDPQNSLDVLKKDDKENEDDTPRFITLQDLM